MNQITKIVVSGARGPRGLSSGPLGAGAVDAETISDDSGEQAAILAKLGAASADALASTASGDGAELVGLGLDMGSTPASGTVAASAFRRRVQASVDYGLPADNAEAANNVAVIQAVLDGLEDQNGGVLELPRGWNGHVNDMLQITGQNVGIEGQGGRENINASGIGADPSTALIYTGADAIEAVIKFHTPIDPGNVQRIGGGIKGVSIDGSNKAGIGVYAYGRSDYTLEQIFITGVTSYGLACDGPDADELADAYGTQGCVIRNISVRLVDGGAQNDANGVLFDGSANRNFSFNHVEMVDTLTLHGDGQIYNNCDTNLFSLMRAFPGGGATGWGMTLRGGFRVDGSVADVGDLPSPPVVPWAIGTVYRVISDGTYRRWNGTSYDIVTVPAGDSPGFNQLGSVGCFGNTWLRPSWLERPGSPGSGNIRVLGADNDFWQPAEGNHFLDVDDGNASLYPAYFSSDAVPPRNSLRFTLEPRSYGSVLSSPLFGASVATLRWARQNLTAGMPGTFVMDGATSAFLQLLSQDGKLNLEQSDADSVRFRSPDSSYTELQFFMALRGLSRMIWHPGSTHGLTANGELTVYAPSNTEARIAFRGSDGVVRTSSAITLS